MISRRGLLMAFVGMTAPVTSNAVAAPHLDGDSTYGFKVGGQLSDAGGHGEYALGTELFLSAKPRSTAQQRLDALVGASVCLTVLRESCE